MSRGRETRSTPLIFGASNWHVPLIRTPYKPGGFTRKGIDCYGLVRLAYLWRLGIYIEPFKARATYKDWDGIRKDWEEVERVQPFDVVLLRAFGAPAHLGVMLDGEQFLHALPVVGVRVGRATSPRWENKVLGYFRHRSVAGEKDIHSEGWTGDIPG